MAGYNAANDNPGGLGGRNLAPDPGAMPPAAISGSVHPHAADPSQLRAHALLVAVRHGIEQSARAHGGEAIAEHAGEVAARAALPVFEVALRVESIFLRTGAAWQRSGVSLSSLVTRAVHVALRCYAADGGDDERDLRAGAALFDAAGPHVEILPAERIALAAGVAAGARFIASHVAADALRAALETNGAQLRAGALAMSADAAVRA